MYSRIQCTGFGYRSSTNVGANCFDIIVSVGKEANDPAVAPHRNMESSSELRSERPMCFACVGDKCKRRYNIRY